MAGSVPVRIGYCLSLSGPLAGNMMLGPSIAAVSARLSGPRLFTSVVRMPRRASFHLEPRGVTMPCRMQKYTKSMSDETPSLDLMA